MREGFCSAPSKATALVTGPCSLISGAYILGHRQLQQVNRLLSIFVMDPEEIERP